MMNVGLEYPGNLLRKGVKEGLVMFLTTMAIFEQVGVNMKQATGGALINMERAKRPGGGMLAQQVILGNYVPVTRERAGFYGDYPGGFYEGRFPTGDEGILQFLTAPAIEAVDWLTEKALATAKG